MNREDLIEMYGDCIESSFLADGFDDAILGIDAVDGRVIYSVAKMTDILVLKEGMDPVDAMEHLDYNVINAYVGKHTPIFLL